MTQLYHELLHVYIYIYIYEGARGAIVIVIVNGHGVQSQILDEDARISQSANTLGWLVIFYGISTIIG